jgi:hypothetical protein
MKNPQTFPEEAHFFLNFLMIPASVSRVDFE